MDYQTKGCLDLSADHLLTGLVRWVWLLPLPLLAENRQNEITDQFKTRIHRIHYLNNNSCAIIKHIFASHNKNSSFKTIGCLYLTILDYRFLLRMIV